MNESYILQQASMRPRRFRRGELASAIPAGNEPLAGFNEAPAIPPGRAGSSSQASVAGKASMRPRRFRRGEVGVERPVPVEDVASMRPRRFRRGEGAPASSSSTWPVLLQ